MSDYKRIVVKIGTGVLTENGRLSESALQRIVSQVAALRKNGVEAVVVTSGAGAAGKALLTSSISADAERQVASAIGQIELISLYKKFFDEAGYLCAQILVTKEDFRDRGHYANMKACFENLLKENVIPVVNENDPIAASGVTFTDNDELAGLIAAQLSSDAVIFLTSVEGVLDDAGNAVPEIDANSFASYEKHVTDSRSLGGRGGMKSKFAVAKKLMAQGISAFIANGSREDVIRDIGNGEHVGTKFTGEKKVSGVKRRLAHAEGFSAGAVYVDAGAEKMLRSKKSVSLLPVGITKVEGEFKKGDVIEVRSAAGEKLGFGIAQYAAKEAETLKGQKGAKALIHYDYLFVG